MTTFTEWKKLAPVREMITALVGDIGLDSIPNWNAYKHAIWQADRSNIVDRANAWVDHRENEEIVAFAAVLWTMDYASLAGEICQKAGITNVFGPFSYLDDNHRKTVAGAFAQVDGTEPTNATTIPTITDADRDAELEREGIIISANRDDAIALKRAEDLGITDGRGIFQYKIIEDTLIEKTATICTFDAPRLQGWKLSIMLANDRGGLTSFRKDDFTLFVHDADFTVHHAGVSLTDGVATLEEALDLVDATERKAA